MAKVDKTLIYVASKKVLGKAHTSNIQDLSNETVPSNVQASTQTTFGENVPNTVDTTTFYSIQSGTVEYLEFNVNSIIGSDYDEDSYSGTGGSENSDNTYHGYYLTLPSDYEASSSNPLAASGFFVDDSIVYNTRGKLQLVPPLLSNAASNKYNLTLYNQDGDRIFPGDEIDWTIDYYNGIIFVQDPQTDNVPTTARAFLYVGKFADEMITEASGSGGGISYSRTQVTTTITASVSSTILGVTASSSVEIRLPSAGDYEAGQYFTVKDESGLANTNNITILASGSQTIDGQASIVLESPYAAVNLYSNGTDKFFIY